MYITSFQGKEEQLNELQECVAKVLNVCGEDTQREGLLRTPERVAKCILQFTNGYDTNPIEVLNSAKFQETYSKPVVVKNIEFYSLCEHHMLPFFGKVHVAYIPDGYIVGLSKIPRVVDIFSHRLQVQERFTRELCQCINESIHPRGVMVVVEAQHMCMQMRGVEKQGAVTVTSDFAGEFADEKLRQEIYAQIKA